MEARSALLPQPTERIYPEIEFLRTGTPGKPTFVNLLTDMKFQFPGGIFLGVALGLRCVVHRTD